MRGNIQTITVEVSDDDTNEKISDARVNGEVEYASGSTSNGGKFDKDTESDGEASHSWRISGNANPGTLDVTVKVTAPGYNTETDETTFEVIEKSEDTNDTSSQNNSTDAVNNNSTLANGDQSESNDDLDCKDIGESNIPVGDDDPNNLDGDNDGIGCESNEGNGSQTNNEGKEKPKTDDETTQEILEGIDGTVIGGTSGDSSDSGSEQTDRDGDGVSNEQPSDNGDTDGNDGENEDQDAEENGEEQDNDEENSDDSDSENNN